MNNKSIISKAILYVSLLAFMCSAVYILYINQEVLYTAHDRSEFLPGTPFFDRLMSKPFGLMQYVGAWLTQLFYHPALGAAVLSALWALIFIVGAKAFRLHGSASALMLLPIACLLTSIVDIGYWIYIFTIRGYWFSQSVGYLVMLLLLWIARSTPRKWHLMWYLMSVLLYPVLGWFALLLILCLALTQKPSWREGVGFTLMLFAAFFWRGWLYSDLKLDDVVLAGLPRFITPSDRSDHLTTPFYVLGTVSLLIPLCRRYLFCTKSENARLKVKWFFPLLCAVASIFFAWTFMFKDKNYINEMRMVRYGENDQWQDVLKVYADNPKPTTTMVFLKNVALMHEGGILDRSFKSGNIGFNINNPDTLHVSFLNIASPLVDYNYGMMNESIRLNFELAIQKGFSPFHLKILSRCALAAGDEKLLKRYITLLHHHPFYSDWQPAPVAAKVKELQYSYPDEITGVENSDSYIVNSICLWYKADNKVASEQALLYSMIRCDGGCFWPSLRKFLVLHEGEDFPVHAQEAYILFMDRAPEEKRMMIPVEQDIYERYLQFCATLERKVKPGLTLGMVAEDMRDEWGDTYWYYFFFGRQYSNVFNRENNRNTIIIRQ